jgi:DNA-binding NarL/FixJ family response regulator
MSTEEADKPARLAGIAVLVVEDEALVALDLEMILTQLGCRVVGPVASVRQGLMALQTAPPDAVLLDVALQDGRSIPLAEALRAAGIAFAVMSGYGESFVEEDVLRNVPRLEKPFSEGAIRTVLTTLLDR